MSSPINLSKNKKFNMIHIKEEARFRQQKKNGGVFFLPSKRPNANNVKKNKERNKNVTCITRVVVTSTHWHVKPITIFLYCHF